MQASSDAYDLPDWGPLAISAAKGRLAIRLDPILRLHQHLKRVVGAHKEVMLVQVRLAWWRDELRKPRAEHEARPADPLLAGLLEGWAGEQEIPIALVDAWESVLAERPWPTAVSNAFVTAYGDAFAGLAEDTSAGEAAAVHGACWARAELVLIGWTNDRPIGPLTRLPADLRALAVIGGLSRRALQKPGRPLLGDRLSPLVAMRLGILGR